MQHWIILFTILIYNGYVVTGQVITLGIKHVCSNEMQDVCHTTKKYHFVTDFKVNMRIDEKIF